MQKDHIQNSIGLISNKFQKYPDIFLTESDVRAHLFAELSKNAPIRKTKDKSKSIDVHSEVRFYGQNGKLKYRTDIAIINVSQLSTRNSDWSKLPSKGYAFDEASHIIEIKLRRVNGTSNNQFLKAIEEDLKKLDRISRNISRQFTGYALVLDKKGDISNEIEHLQRRYKPTKIVYMSSILLGNL